MQNLHLILVRSNSTPKKYRGDGGGGGGSSSSDGEYNSKFIINK